MAVFHGKQGKGAMRAHRAEKVREAVERQAKFDAEVRDWQNHTGNSEQVEREHVRSLHNFLHEAREAIAKQVAS
jgi:hypothetical protein